MLNADELESTKNRYIRDYHVEKEKLARSYIRIFLNNLIHKFRLYNNDRFTVHIKGVDRFVNNRDFVLNFLLQQLRQNGFDIELPEGKFHLAQIDVEYVNAATKQPSHFSYRIQDLVSVTALSGATDIPVIGIIIMRIISQIVVKLKKLYKAIVLDLDDTLWPGTISEIGINGIRENLNSYQGVQFIAFMKFCRVLATELGIFIAICSKNNPVQIRDTIDNHLSENIFPLRDQIDCLIANDNDKSENIEKIADELSILTDSIVFIDDNQLIRDEVKVALPGVFVPEWSSHDELLTQLVAGCIFERTELSISSQNRRRQYKIIQTERSKNLLPELSIREFCDDDHIEAIELYSKSNQFKTSGINNNFQEDAKSLCFEIYRSNGENLGTCSTITYSCLGGCVTVVNWAISCRYFNIGVEEFILLRLNEITKSGRVLINYQKLDHNNKAKELLEKYGVSSEKNAKETTFSITFTKAMITKVRNCTNLRGIDS